MVAHEKETEKRRANAIRVNEAITLVNQVRSYRYEDGNNTGGERPEAVEALVLSDAPPLPPEKPYFLRLLDEGDELDFNLKEEAEILLEISDSLLETLYTLQARGPKSKEEMSQRICTQAAKDRLEEKDYMKCFPGSLCFEAVDTLQDHFAKMKVDLKADRGGKKLLRSIKKHFVEKVFNNETLHFMKWLRIFDPKYVSEVLSDWESSDKNGSFWEKNQVPDYIISEEEEQEWKWKKLAAYLRVPENLMQAFIDYLVVADETNVGPDDEKRLHDWWVENITMLDDDFVKWVFFVLCRYIPCTADIERFFAYVAACQHHQMTRLKDETLAERAQTWFNWNSGIRKQMVVEQIYYTELIGKRNGRTIWSRSKRNRMAAAGEPLEEEEEEEEEAVIQDEAPRQAWQGDNGGLLGAGGGGGEDNAGGVLGINLNDIQNFMRAQGGGESPQLPPRPGNFLLPDDDE